MTDLTDDDLRWMNVAIDWSRRCPYVPDRFNVGAVIVADGRELSHGYSRDTDRHVHAEESALSRLDAVDLSAATIYTTMEPCTVRASRPLTCTQLILASGIRRVVYAVLEPAFLVECDGIEQLRRAGLTVLETPTLAAAVHEVNSHIPWD
jgi:diaminohydroxyphosphoribosylaminopyrimidine deaminase / 5-amino-6-(5-phosphoribosylamino)uracil reductase